MPTACACSSRAPRELRRRRRARERPPSCFREALALWRGPTLAGLQLESLGRDEVGAARRAAAGGADGPDRLRPRARPARTGARRAERARARAPAAGTAPRAADARPLPGRPAGGGARRLRRGAADARRRPRHRAERGAATAPAGDPPPRPVPRDAGGHRSGERTRTERGPRRRRLPMPTRTAGEGRTRTRLRPRRWQLALAASSSSQAPPQRRRFSRARPARLRTSSRTASSESIPAAGRSARSLRSGPSRRGSRLQESGIWTSNLTENTVSRYDLRTQHVDDAGDPARAIPESSRTPGTPGSRVLPTPGHYPAHSLRRHRPLSGLGPAGCQAVQDSSSFAGRRLARPRGGVPMGGRRSVYQLRDGRPRVADQPRHRSRHP